MHLTSLALAAIALFGMAASGEKPDAPPDGAKPPPGGWTLQGKQQPWPPLPEGWHPQCWAGAIGATNQPHKDWCCWGSDNPIDACMDQKNGRAYKETCKGGPGSPEYWNRCENLPYWTGNECGGDCCTTNNTHGAYYQGTACP